MRTTIVSRALVALVCSAALATAAPGADAGPETEAGFELHSGFWINLHHFLYQQARIRGQADRSLRPPGGGSPAAPASLEALSAAERSEWTVALDHYASGPAKHDLLFNQELIEVKTKLGAAEGRTSLETAGLDPALRAALERAAPVYRAHWWAEHDRANRAWIRAVRPLLKRHAPTVTGPIAAALRGSWPQPPIRVDVTTYANWSGAYTTDEPLHVTVSSVYGPNQGPAGLELLLHEPSHVILRARSGPIPEALQKAFDAHKRPVPRDLWHAILFYTTGEIARRALEEGGVRGYEPYAYKQGLYSNPPWSAFRRALEAHWLPYLNGKTDFETAIGRVADAVVKLDV